MSLAKAVVTGSVFRAPEKRFTQNNVPVSSFVLNIGDREEMLIRVVVRRAALDEVVSGISKDDRVLVEGRLQITTVKSDTGAERRIFEIDANTIEMMGAGAPAAVSSASDKDAAKLKRYLTEAGKIIPRRVTGNCAEHQRMVAKAIKRAREAAIISYVFD